MKKKSLLLLLLPILLLAACNKSETTAPFNNNDDVEIIDDGQDEEQEETGDNQEEHHDEQEDHNDHEEHQDEQEDTFVRQQLSCGSLQAPLPKNYKSPFTLRTTLSADSSSWSNNEMYEYMPTNFRYIYKNSYDDGPSGEKTSPGFYAYDPKNKAYPGGLKLTRPGEGFQTPAFTHNGAKLEVHIGISNVTNNSKTPEKGKDPLYLYFFNAKGTLIGTKSIEENTITTKTTDLKIYYEEPNAKDVSYMELRLNTYPYKGSQAYNIGVGYFNFKSWERA